MQLLYKEFFANSYMDIKKHQNSFTQVTSSLKIYQGKQVIIKQLTCSVLSLITLVLEFPCCSDPGPMHDGKCHVRVEDIYKLVENQWKPLINKRESHKVNGFF